MNTSPASKGPVEARLGTKLRDMSDRTRNLENKHPKRIRVGGWRLSEDKDGNLVATYPATGTTQILAWANRPKEIT